MHRHPNARRTPRGHADLSLAVEAGMTVTAACAAFGVSRRCYYRWLPRWQARGRAGLVDRSSRPHSGPRRLPLEQEAIVAALPRQTGWGATRLVDAELLPDERALTTTRFALRALRWSATRGVRVQRPARGGRPARAPRGATTVRCLRSTTQ